jgi:hypothetical protein
MKQYLSGYVYFKPLTKKQVAGQEWIILDLTPNKLYKVLDNGDILDDVGYRLPVRTGSPSVFLGMVGAFHGATKRTLFRTLKGWTKLTVQADEGGW